MIRVLIISFLFLTVSPLLGGCNFRIDKAARGPSDFDQGLDKSAGAATDFAAVSAKILGPRCVECHTEFVGYAGVQASLAEIRRLVALNVMPKNRSALSDAEKAYLFAWIDAGAPEFAVAPAPAPPAPEPPVVEPPPVPEPPPVETLNFAVVKARVFDPRCIRCHGTRGGVNLETYPNVARDLMRIRDSIETGAMPRGEPLSAEQKDLVLRWIAIGAPEN